MSATFDRIKAGLEEALAHVRGEDIGVIEHVILVPAPPDVAAIRRTLGMTQARFAAAVQVPLGTVQGWEQRRRIPRGPARALLLVLEREPEAAQRALALDEVTR